MHGAELFDTLAKAISTELGGQKVSNTVLARHLGLSLPALKALRDRDLSPTDIADVIKRHGKAVERKLCDDSIRPIVEFFELVDNT